MWYPEKRSADILAWIREKKGIEYVEDCGRYTVKDLGILWMDTSDTSVYEP